MVVPHSTGQLRRSMVRVPGSGLDREAMPSCLDLSRVSSLAASVPVPRLLPKALVKNFQSDSAEEAFGSKTSKLVSDVKLESKKTVAEGVVGQKRPYPLDQEECEMTSSSTPPAPKVARIAVVKPLQAQTIPTYTAPAQPTQIYMLSSSINGHSVPASQIVSVTQLNGMMPQPMQIQPQQYQVIATTLLPHYVNQHLQRPSQNSPRPSLSSEGVTTNSAAQVKQSISQLIEERNRLQSENKALQDTLVRYQNLFKNKESLRKIARYVSQTVCA